MSRPAFISTLGVPEEFGFEISVVARVAGLEPCPLNQRNGSVGKMKSKVQGDTEDGPKLGESLLAFTPFQHRRASLSPMCLV